MLSGQGENCAGVHAVACVVCALLLLLWTITKCYRCFVIFSTALGSIVPTVADQPSCTYIYASVCMRLWCVYLSIYIILYSHIRIHDSYFSSSTTNRYVSIIACACQSSKQYHLFSGRHTRIHFSKYCYNNSGGSIWCDSHGAGHSINCWNNYYNYYSKCYVFSLEKVCCMPFADI